MHVKDIEFSPSGLLDLYLADLPHRPLVVCVHGGGFVSGDKDDPRCVQAASILRDAGFNCASISYSLAGENDRALFRIQVRDTAGAQFSVAGQTLVKDS